jgi:hypothetical protein
MTDVQPLPSPQQDTTSPTSSGLGWPMAHGLETSIDVSRETSMERADLGWPE